MRVYTLVLSIVVHLAAIGAADRRAAHRDRCPAGTATRGRIHRDQAHRDRAAASARAAARPARTPQASPNAAPIEVPVGVEPEPDVRATAATRTRRSPPSKGRPCLAMPWIPLPCRRHRPTGAPVQVGGSISRPERIHYVAPDYPPLARAARREGTVILEAVLDTDGRVREARVLRSVPLLDAAALEAVQQWRSRRRCSTASRCRWC